MNIKIDRTELVSTTKEINATGLVDKVKTKDVPDFQLLIAFLEAVESIPEGSPDEAEIPQSVIKYYNKMARKIEKLNSQAILEFIENETAPKKETSPEVKEVTNFLKGKPKEPTKTKLKQVTDVLYNIPDASTKDIFGLKIGGKRHEIIRRLVAGKSEGFLVKKDIADKSEITSSIDFVKKKNPGIVVTKEHIDGKFFYKFFGEKEFWQDKGI